jgi:hypothetical protein
MTKCTFDPLTLIGKPIGMLHCPGDENGPCGCMLIAGLDHPPCDDDCPMQDDADRSAWEELMRRYARESEEQGERLHETMMRAIEAPVDPDAPKLTYEEARKILDEAQKHGRAL